MSLSVALLAGGMATRLYPLTKVIPKSLVDVAGRPFICHQMELLRRNGLVNIVICAGYLGEKVQEALGDGSEMGLYIQYAFDGRMLLGTGGAIRKALPLLGDPFFVLYGDSFLEIDYQQIEHVFSRSANLGLMTVYKNSGRWDQSNVLFRNGQIVAYDKKRPVAEMQYIDYGLGVFRKSAFDGVPEGQFYDLANVYRTLVKHEQLGGFEVHQRFYEIGSPEGLAETRAYLDAQLRRKDGDGILRAELPKRRREDY